MTDYEEPAAKISKLEEAAKDQDEDMDEGQEEWLSEGILTDDDYPIGDQDKSNINETKSIDGDTTPSLPDDDLEDNSLPDDKQIQDNSFILDNSQPEDNSNAQDNSIAQENLDAHDNSITQENYDAQDTSLSQDNLPIEENSESKEYSHIDDISQAQLGTYAQFNSEVQNSSIAQDDTLAQDKSDAQKNLLSQVDSKTEHNSNAQVKAQARANSNAQNSRNDQNKVEPMSMEQTLNENIEQTLDNFENSRQSEIPAELGSFLVRKSDNKNADVKKDGSETDASSKHSDDGNDTDELLRMLGEDGQKGKKEEKTKKVDQKRAPDSHSSDDDEFVFEGAKVARLKLAKTARAISKKHPTKAVPETVSEREDDSDGSSDEGDTMKKMFVTRKTSNFAAKRTSKRLAVRDSAANVTKKIVTVHRRPAPAKRPVTSTPLPKLMSKPEITIKKIKAVKKDPPKKVEQPKVKVEPKEVIETKESAKPKVEPDEIIDEEGFLEGEAEFDLNEDFHSEPKQRIMKPEEMDEEVPTDEESQDDDDDADSFFDELPSSGSDQDEWFTLDIRSERAGDYIPLLGSKARLFLTAEKKRVTSRLQSLRQEISALNESRRQQADMLRKATTQLAELDAALKA